MSSTYGLTIDLPDDLREQYAKAGYVAPNAADSGKRLVPIPATYLVDRSGRIAMRRSTLTTATALNPHSSFRHFAVSSAPPREVAAPFASQG